MASIFTRIIEGEIPGSFILKQERWVAFLDINPVSPGHILLVPRQEVALLPELDGASLAETGAWLARLDCALRQVTGCAAVSVLLRDGPVAGQEVPHLHWHLIPRHSGDRAHHFASGSYASDEERERMRAALQAALDRVQG
ncbi:MAG: HIT family protein [Planctomycetota bacterium]|nr:MAG: HIT family protein [Planctomycetota bacterium]